MSENSTTKTFDPSEFQIDPTLRGLPLASPWRRAGALLMDLILIAALTQTGSLTFSTLTAIATFWAITRGGTPGWRRWIRRLGGVGAAGFVFLVVLTLTWDGPEYYSSNVDWKSFGEAMSSGDPESQKLAAELLEAGFESDFSEGHLAETLGFYGVRVDLDSRANGPTELSTEETIALLNEQIRGLKGEGEGEGAQKLMTVESARANLQTWAAGPELQAAKATRVRLARELSVIAAQNRQLQDEIDNPSLKHIFQAAASDLGLSLGWGGLYFTLFLALAAGRTPGKWLFRLRVARLDGRPVTLWTSFERFAGYAAGLATGLLGFLQVFWDRNGRTVQDTIGGTVVLFDPRGRS